MRGKKQRHDPARQPVDVDETVAPRELNHFGQRRAVVITANLAPGYYDGRGAEVHGRGCCPAFFPPATRSTDAGQSREFKISASLALTFVLLAGLHLPGAGSAVRELPRPFIIMLTVPLSMTGALLAL